MNAVSDFIARLVHYIIQPLIVLLMAVALAYFIYGAAQFILHADDEEARKKGKKHLLWGLVGFLIMVGAISILGIVTATFGVSLPR